MRLDFPCWGCGGRVVVKEGGVLPVYQFPAELMEAFPAWPALRKNCVLRHILMAGRDGAEGGAGKDVQTCQESPKEWRVSAGIAEFKWKSFGMLFFFFLNGSLSFHSRPKFERFMVIEKKNVQISSLKNEKKYPSHPQYSALDFRISKTSGWSWTEVFLKNLGIHFCKWTTGSGWKSIL